MKQLLTFSAIILASICVFTSCKKEYTCNCDIKTYVLADKDTVKSVTSSTIIRTTKDDALDQCEDYELEVNYLGRPSIDYYKCGIVED